MTENRARDRGAADQDRKRELEAWRQRTGRTPMKRLSYLQPCATPIPATPVLLKPITHSVSSYSVRHRRKTDTRNREKLAATVTKSILKPSIHKESTHSPTEERRRQDRAQRELMKELFQCDIDDTVAEILAEEEEEEGGGEHSNADSTCAVRDMAGGDPIDARADQVKMCTSPSPPKLDYSPEKSVHKKHKRRVSSAFFVNQELAFESSKIQYVTVASEQRGRGKRRSKQRRTYDQRQLLYLTPVKRSTRRSLSLCRTPRGGTCYDSPSQAEGLDGYEGVKILPNQALVL